MLTFDVGGKWSAFEVGIIVPRQSGKGALLEARQLAGLYLERERLALHSAHEFRTCFEHFLRVTTLIEQCPELDAKVMRIRRGAGEQAIELRSGQRLRFIARSSGSGRGLSGDTVYLDEAFALTPEIMGALLPTLSARPNPQLIYTSSAPRATSRVLHDLVKRGRAGDSPRLFYAEWGCSADVAVDDRDAWYRVNPALGIRISEEFVEAELEAMRGIPQEFLRERLGVPEEPVDVAGAVLSLEQWAACADPKSSAVDPVVFGVDASPDRQWASIVVAARTPAGGAHVEVVDHHDGVAWLSARLVELRDRWGPSTVVVDPYSPAASEIATAEAKGVPITKVSGAVLAAASGAFYDAVIGRTLHHRDDPEFRTALVSARKRPVGDGWTWSRRGSGSDITPLVAATLALSALPGAGPRPMSLSFVL